MAWELSTLLNMMELSAAKEKICVSWLEVVPGGCWLSLREIGDKESAAPKNFLVFTCSLCENRHSPLKLNLSLSAAGFKRFLLFTFKGNGICFWFVPHFSVSQRKASYSQSVCRQAGVFDVGYRWQKSDSNQKNYNALSANWLRNTNFYHITTNCSLVRCSCVFSNQSPAISCRIGQGLLITIVVTHAKQQTS